MSRLLLVSSSVLAALLLPPLARGGNPFPSTPHLRWFDPTPAGQQRVPRSVSIGNRGTFVWVGNALGTADVRLYGAASGLSGANPVAPVASFPVGNATRVLVAAADDAPFCAAIVTTTSAAQQLYLFDAFSAAAVATTNVPIHPQFGDPIKVEMSDDGGRIAVAYHDSTGLGTVTIYDTAGGSGITAIQTTNAVNSGMKDMDLSGDGDTVVLAGHVDDFIVTVSGGGIVYTDHSNTFPTEARDTSADGKTWVRGGMQAAAFRDSGSGYQSLFQYTDPTQAVVMFHAAAVSKDGRTFVAAGYDPTNMPQLLVYCFDLAQPTGQPLWKYSAPATGTLECLATEADVADDGERIVVSCYGDGSGAFDEVLIFERSAGPAPLYGIDFAGSAYDVAISGDGQIAAAVGADQHESTIPQTGVTQVFDLGGQGLWLEGAPAPGAFLRLHFGGPAGDASFLMAGLALAAAPIEVFPLGGALQLDPQQLVLPPTFLTNFPVFNTYALSATLPFTPAAVGLTIHAQAARQGSSNEFDNVITLPITP